MSGVSDIGSSLVEARAAKMTQRDLGERLGVKQQQVARWEANRYRSASLERVVSVARALGVEPSLIAAETHAAYGQRAGGTVLLADIPAMIAACSESHVAELALFGSALAGTAGPESDVDLLVTFAADARPRLSDLTRLRDRLSAAFGREVDLVERRGIEASDNPIRTHEILSTARTIYAA